MSSISAALRDAAGQERGRLVVSELPGGAKLASGDGVVLAEGQRYRYEVEGVDGVVEIEPAELFDADDYTRRGGRMAPGQSVGRVVIAVRAADAPGLTGVIEVLPAKLSQGTEYRQMLTDITAHAAEAVLQGFAPSAIDAAMSTRHTDLLYQRFVVLESRLRSDEFAAAMGRILGDPHVEWRSTTEYRPPGSAFPRGSAFGRTFTAPGPRRPWLTGRDRPTFATMPAMLARPRHEASVDTTPNRFIKYLLEAWRALAQQLSDGLATAEETPIPGPVRRGRRAADEVLEILDELLSQPLFGEVGRLDQVPTSNQVLLKREGYRQLMQMFVLVEAGLELPWGSDADDVYSPTLRNVATLYEIWSYLALVDVVGDLCGRNQAAQAFTTSANGLSLHLKSGHRSALHWTTVRRGRPLDVSLMFNRPFTSGHDSWTAPMRPDCSLLISPRAAVPGPDPDLLAVWVHFDAKYRVSGGPPIDLLADIDDEDGPRGMAKRDDLLKMHAYRDAIRRTAGAYILYPGDQPCDLRPFRETLPGLGAFPLRPGPDEPVGIEAIRTFVSDVLDHVAEQASQHERDRYWRARIYDTPVPNHSQLEPILFLDRPPADTDVLVGYVRGAKHRAWVQQNRCYNVRADDRTGAVRLGSRELGAPFVLLYERSEDGFRIVELARAGEWRAVDRRELLAAGYPEPRGRLYLVTTLDPVPNPPDWLSQVTIESLTPESLARGAPHAVTWLDLMASVQS